MLNINLGSLPKSRFIDGLIYPFMMKALDEVSMIEIAKTCKIHGKLNFQQVRIRTPNNISCKACNLESTRKHRLKNKEMLLQKAQEYRDKNRERLRKINREWKANDYKERKYIYSERCKKFYKNNPDKYKNQRLVKLYGITLIQYKEMLLKQNNLCYICKKPETAFHKNSDRIKDLCVDHCHKTGKVRSLLCTRCNCLIGYSEESIDKLQEAIKYLREFKNDCQREQL